MTNFAILGDIWILNDLLHCLDPESQKKKKKGKKKEVKNRKNTATDYLILYGMILVSNIFLKLRQLFKNQFSYFISPT